MHMRHALAAAGAAALAAMAAGCACLPSIGRAEAPKAQTGNLTVLTSEPNAEVYIRWTRSRPWELLGTTPLEKAPLVSEERSEHFSMKIQKPGCRTLEFERIRLRPDAELFLSFDLPAGADATGNLADGDGAPRPRRL